MQKYIKSKYVVLQEENGQETYLSCRGNAEIYRYNDDILCLYTPFISSKIIKAMQNIQTDCIKGDCECIFYFKESDLSKVDKVIKIKTKDKYRLKKPIEPISPLFVDKENNIRYHIKCDNCINACKQSYKIVVHCS
jgi:hypothetical protein